MLKSSLLALALGCLTGPVVSRPSTIGTIKTTDAVAPHFLIHERANPPCAGNTAADRGSWCEYSTSTNYYTDGPDTGVIREYWLELTNITAAPDGIERVVLAVNGTIPGPTLEADWGDTVVVHVTNSLTNNGSSIHFHGLRQYFTNPSDGVTSVTQCPTAPGQTTTYTWKASEYGSSWYHSHYGLQAWDGIFGGIVVHGPATANYDVDLGNLFLTDWDHQPASALYEYAETHFPVVLDTGLINGTNTWDNGSIGERWQTTFTPGQSYLIRLVNAAIDTHFDFSIDNHTLTVISTDFVPIVPYSTHSISIGMGQRYDVVVTADQADVARDFWLRAVPDSFCSDNEHPDDIRGIIHYGNSVGTPTTAAYTTTEKNCTGEPYASLVPYLALNAGTTADVSSDQQVTVGLDSQNLFRWYLNGISFHDDWQEPTALLVLENRTDFASSSHVIELPTANEWMYLIIETTLGAAHPLHLHGHDFFVLAQGLGTYADAKPTLKTTNPPRRDVTMLPAQGYTVIAFQADNPGVWLMHCHIGWHTDMGFALQFVERYSEIAPLYDAKVMNDTCKVWDTWQTAAGLVQFDDGI